MKLLLSVVAVDIAIAVKIRNMHCVLSVFCNAAICKKWGKIIIYEWEIFGYKLQSNERGTVFVRGEELMFFPPERVFYCCVCLSFAC